MQSECRWSLDPACLHALQKQILTHRHTLSLTGTDTKSSGEKKKKSLLTQRLYIAQANLHVTSQRPLVGLELPVFYEWWSRGGV